jgi:thioester reductase-like protein
MTYLLLTGATGLVGRHLLRDLLVAGVPLAVMVRPGKGPTKLEGILRHWEEQLRRFLPRPIVVEGDLCLDEVVPDTSQRAWLRGHCGAILNCAASMTFREDKRGEPFRTNVEGTRHLLELCRWSGIRRFHHVSTAYLCGLREGVVLESDVDVGQRLGNVYEQSKLTAEKMIREADCLDQRTFYRPASVVGDSETGYVTSFHGFYLPLQLASVMASRVPVTEMNERFFARLGLRGDEGKNLVPVDWLSSAIVHLFTHPEHHGRTYHLAAADPVPVSDIQRVVRQAVERYHPHPLASSITVAEIEKLEGLFYEYMSIYQSHWRDDPKFDLTNTRAALPHLPCPKFTSESLLRIARYPVERSFIPPRHEVQGTDFAVANHLQRLLDMGLGRSAATADRTVGLQTIGLQINGPGGGQWSLLVEGDRICAAEWGLPEPGSPGFYLSATTFRLLATGELSVSEAVSSARLVWEASPGQSSEMIAVFSHLLGVQHEAIGVTEQTA